MLAQSAFEDASDEARNGNIAEAIRRAQEGIETLHAYVPEEATA